MIVKRLVYKNGVKFRRVKYNPSHYLCGQYKCKYRTGDMRSYDDPICDLCKYVRDKFAFVENLYIPDDNKEISNNKR